MSHAEFVEWVAYFIHAGELEAAAARGETLPRIAESSDANELARMQELAFFGNVK